MGRGGLCLECIRVALDQNEVVKAAREGAGGEEKSLRVAAFAPNERAEKADRLLVVFNQDLVGDEQDRTSRRLDSFLIEPSAKGIGSGTERTQWSSSSKNLFRRGIVFQ